MCIDTIVLEHTRKAINEVGRKNLDKIKEAVRNEIISRHLHLKSLAKEELIILAGELKNERHTDSSTSDFHYSDDCIEFDSSISYTEMS